MKIRINEKISVEVSGDVTIDELRAITSFADAFSGGVGVVESTKSTKPTVQPKPKRKKFGKYNYKYDWDHIEGFIKDYLEQGNVLSGTSDALLLAGVPSHGGNRQRIAKILDKCAVRVGNIYMSRYIKENGLSVKKSKKKLVQGYRGNKQWNSEEISILEENWDQRKSVMSNAQKLSKIIGRTPSQIQSRYYVLKEKGNDLYG